MPKKRSKATANRKQKKTSKPRISQPFDREKHVYRNDAFVELVKDAVRFFNGTPVHALLPPERFYGAGIYALYYTGKSKIYSKYADLNRLAYESSIYLGKAVPQGWRRLNQIGMFFIRGDYGRRNAKEKHRRRNPSWMRSRIF